MSQEEYTIEELKKDKVNYHIKVIVPSKIIESETDLELSKVAKTATISGFRPGKVPMSMLRKKHHSSLRADIAQNKIIDLMNKIKSDNKLKTFTEPLIENVVNEDSKNLEFTLKYDLLPEIKLPDFKRMTIEKPVLDVQEKEIEAGLDKLARIHTTYDTQKETTAAKKGDKVIIDSQIFVDGKEFEEGKMTDFSVILGSGNLISEFEDQLVGAKAKSDITIKIKLPEDYIYKHFAGKPAEFKTHVKEVLIPSVPKIDDEFAKTLEINDLKELKAEVSLEIANAYLSEIYIDMKMKFFDKLENLLKFDVPEALLSKEINALKHQTEHSVAQDENTDKKSEKEREEYYKKLATRRVRIGLMLADYVQHKNIQITQNDINQEILKQARKFPSQASQIFELYYKDTRVRDTIHGTVLEDKAVQYIFENEISITEKKYTKEKLEKMLYEEDKRK